MKNQTANDLLARLEPLLTEIVKAGVVSSTLIFGFSPSAC